MAKYAHPLDLKLKHGALHKTLHVPVDKKIGSDKLEKALGSSNELTRKRAQFAENASHWNHGGK
jgi:hypothetical protein